MNDASGIPQSYSPEVMEHLGAKRGQRTFPLPLRLDSSINLSMSRPALPGAGRLAASIRCRC